MMVGRVRLAVRYKGRKEEKGEMYVTVANVQGLNHDALGDVLWTDGGFG